MKRKIICILVSAFIVSIVAFCMHKRYEYKRDIPTDIYSFLKADVRENSVVLFEPNPYHYECTPGYLKYLVDLGYNVDLLVQPFAEDALCRFEKKDNVRCFNYEKLDDIKKYSSLIKKQFEKYHKVLVQTADPSKKELYKSLGVLKNDSNSILVFHRSDFVGEQGLSVEKFYDQNRVIFLGDLGKGLYVNPHYFGEFPVHSKNHKTRFFITSTVDRDYTPLIEAAKGLSNSGLDFEVVVTGGQTFTEENVPDEIKEKFIFKKRVLYKDMYNEVQNSDYVMVLLNAERKEDDYFRHMQVTGTAQLSYGFLKPMIINRDFAKFYKLDSENAFLYEQGNLEKTMREAILLKQSDYEKKCNNLKKTADNIFSISLENMRIACGGK